MGACDGCSGVLLQAYLAAHLEQMQAEIWKFSPSREADACFKGESMNPGWRELDKRNCTQHSGAGRASETGCAVRRQLAGCCRAACMGRKIAPVLGHLTCAEPSCCDRLWRPSCL